MNRKKRINSAVRLLLAIDEAYQLASALDAGHLADQLSNAELGALETLHRVAAKKRRAVEVRA